ncbi:MAG: sugar-binding domain-containing protein [Niabella sp.]
MMRNFSFFAVLIFIFFCNVVKAQEKIGKNRKQLFDYDWRFALGNNANAGSLNFDDKNWRQLNLPHDWSIEGRIDALNPMGNDGGYFPSGIGWYRKEFKVPSNLKGKQIGIYFEGVYMNAEVFINGKSLGVWPYGYSSFFFDLTPYIRFDANNMIAVKVDNSQQKNSRWYSGSGIYRHVWLTVTNPISIDQWGVFVTTPAVSKQQSTVQVKTTVVNSTALPRNVELRTSILNRSGIKISSVTLPVQLPANTKKELVQNVEIENPDLWSPDHPNLYAASVAIMQHNKVTDELQETFGIRSIEFSAEKGFLLNGIATKLNGGCVHHDNGCLGAAAFDRAEERKVELLKAAGFNAVRTAHNPPSEAFLRFCNKLGLLVIDEAFDGWRTAKTKHDYAKYFDNWAERDIASMVKRDRNHPSIIMWSIGNEIIERKEPQAVITARTLSGFVKQYDQSRPVTSAMTTWNEGWEIFDPLMAAHDVAGYNYELRRAPSDHARVPSRIIVQTESYPRDAFANWKLVSNNNYIIGDFVWTAMDYLGESGIGRWYYSNEISGEHYEKDLFPWHGAYCGDIDLTGWRKPISHYRNMLYNQNEKLYMAVKEPEPLPLRIKETRWSVWPTWESWTWPAMEAKDIDVEVYSKYPKVKLYLNEKLIGEKNTAEQQKFKAVFTIPYTKGTIKVIGVENDKDVEAKTLRTAGLPTKINLVADRKIIEGNGQDLSFVAVEIVDENGVVVPTCENKLTFTIEGAGVIAGTSNANLKDIESYTSNIRKVWKGKALVVIKSKRQKGRIKLTAQTSGIPVAVIEIETKTP